MSQKLFVRNLSWSVSEVELLRLFEEIGPVVSLKIPLRPEDGKPRGFAFVEMASPADAEEAIRRLNGSYLQGRDLVVSYQDDNRGASPRRSDSAGPVVANSKLFVRNIDSQVSEQELAGLFSQAGQVVSVRIPMDRETGYPKPFGFVEMGSAEEAQQALDSLNNAMLRGKALQLDFQDPNRSSNKPRQHAGGPRREYGYGGGGGGSYRW
jgi:nucleolin